MNKLNSDSPSQDQPFLMTEDRILFEDSYLIAVNKPPGLPTQPTLDEARVNLYASVKKFLAQRLGQTVQDTYLGLHHRLDRDTSGIILFTKSKEANPGIATLFSSHQAEKTYQALASWTSPQKVADSWTIKNHLGRLKTSGKNAKFGAVRSGGDFAHTDFVLVKKMKKCLLVEARLHTGRTHQIRVHLSESGLPILGDQTYGGLSQLDSVNIPRLLLHAVRLTFEHPILQNKICIECPLPEDFSRCLQALQRD
jgi:RluA family pseudouridine synthase